MLKSHKTSNYIQAQIKWDSLSWKYINKWLVGRTNTHKLFQSANSTYAHNWSNMEKLVHMTWMHAHYHYSLWSFWWVILYMIFLWSNITTITKTDTIYTRQFKKHVSKSHFIVTNKFILIRDRMHLSVKKFSCKDCLMI